MAKIPFFSKSRNIVRLLIDCGWEIINFRLHYTICPGNCQLIPYKNIDSFSWNLKGHFILTKELLVRQHHSLPLHGNPWRGRWPGTAGSEGVGGEALVVRAYVGEFVTPSEFAGMHTSNQHSLPPPQSWCHAFAWHHDTDCQKTAF